ncbi:hypothetical protein GYMLUDRAFT_39678 [Collybiopsis luxurians FD-317 M1]|nr:hypothetical protein GYMLUDRAFT_39678 [Collybiopsis luxurians FD-317 M1]
MACLGDHPTSNPIYRPTVHSHSPFRKMQSRGMPNTRRKPHCRSCGSPMEGYRKSERPAYMEKGEDIEEPGESPDE